MKEFKTHEVSIKVDYQDTTLKPDNLLSFPFLDLRPRTGNIVCREDKLNRQQLGNATLNQFYSWLSRTFVHSAFSMLVIERLR